MNKNRRSISVRGETFDRFKARCEAAHASMSHVTEQLIHQYLDLPERTPLPPLPVAIVKTKSALTSLALAAPTAVKPTFAEQRHRNAIEQAKVLRDALKAADIRKLELASKARADQTRLARIKAASDKLRDVPYKGPKPEGVIPEGRRVKSFTV